ncbi:asparagine synthase (glutamine-hydrolyzing) [Sphingomonas sp. F9_3S_D5_B_2]
MLAFAWAWAGDARSTSRGLALRLGASLCAGIGGHAGIAEIGNLQFAYRPLRSTAARSKAWRPAILPSGAISVFHGYFDNAAQVAAELGASANDLSRLYALAVEAWGDETDLRVIGEYCALVVQPDAAHLRLSRSPFRAPPLYYSFDAARVLAGSVPRTFFAAGLTQTLNEARVADSAMINFSDQEASWFEQISRVPLGSVVELHRGAERRLVRYYDAQSISTINVDDAQALRRVGELLDEAVRACLVGFRQPGATLSGGLDSSQVAVRALAALPADQTLPTFTFCPEEGFDNRVQEGTIGDERPIVEAFAAMHPRIEPHFTANEGYGHDHRWNDFFHLMGGAPSGLCNLYVFHGLFAGAAKRGCDLLLVSDWGNNAFSDKGYWGFVEYLLKGRWRQLWLALRRFPIQSRSLMWRFGAQCVLPLLPHRLWRRVRDAVLPGEASMLELMQPLTREYRANSGADQRLAESGLVFERYQPWNARDARRLLLQNDDGESAEIYQGFEQMYGIAQRDPLAYRPLVEYCWSLPTRIFMRDGVMRWLAKELARGIMPEEQRANRLNGRWDSDWHLRIGRRRDDLLAELDKLQNDARLRGMLDIPRLRSALEDWPEQTPTRNADIAAREFTVPRALLTARFIKYVEARNAP